MQRARRAFLLAAAGALALAGGLRGATAAGRKWKIGIIGAGRIGGALGELWAQAGHEVFLSSRHPERLAELAASIGPAARTGLPREAAAFGEVVLIAVPYGALPQIGRDYASELHGKIVLETGNPQPVRDGDMANAARAEGTGTASARFLPGTRLVRAFSTVPHFHLKIRAQRNGERIAIPLAADDAEALAVAAQLVEDAGFEPVVVGALARAREFDIGSEVFARALTARELRQALQLDR